MSGSPGSEGCLRQSQSSLRWLNLGAVPQLLCCSCTFHPVLSATSNLRPSSPWTAVCDVLVNETERRSYVMWPFRGMFLAARRQEESPISQPADPVLASPVMAKKVECPPYFSPHRELISLCSFGNAYKDRAMNSGLLKEVKKLPFFLMSCLWLLMRKKKKKTWLGTLFYFNDRNSFCALGRQS